MENMCTAMKEHLFNQLFSGLTKEERERMRTILTRIERLR